MAWDFSVKVTDVVMIVAVFAGPIVAIQIAEWLRKIKDSRDRKVHIFRTLMATRSAQLASMHVEALNLVDLEFHSQKRQDKRVLDAGRLYIDHLRDRGYPKESWGARKAELLVELLYEMSVSLGYGFDKVQIKVGSYYPSGYDDANNENEEIRKNWLNIVRGNQQLHMKAEIFPSPGSVPPQKQDETEVPTRND
jgi:hypothetical protein